MVDSGSWYTVVTPSIAKELDITPIMKAKVLTADKREIETDLAVAYIKALDREAAVFMAIMEAPEPLVGVEAMEAPRHFHRLHNRSGKTHKTIRPANVNR